MQAVDSNQLLKALDIIEVSNVPWKQGWQPSSMLN